MRLLALLLAVPLNREIVLADTEGRAADARRLRDDFAQINRQHVEAFYRCD